MSIRSRNKPSVEFSSASIADIVFMLLIYFMLTSSFVVQSALEVDLPSSSSNKPSSGANTVTITADLVYAWNQQTVPKEEIPEFIEVALTEDEIDSKAVTLRTDKSVPMEEVAYVMSAVAEFGGKIVIMTEKE
ncbi:MAG: biopolymer transporter ExbD [Bacteroidota bacterium]